MTQINKEEFFYPSREETDRTINIVHKARVTYVMVGYGDLIITDHFLSWNKSATSYLVFGIANTMTDSHLFVPFSEIVSVGKYAYLPGGGLSIMDIKGKVYKFSFKRKKDFCVVYEYLTKTHRISMADDNK